MELPVLTSVQKKLDYFYYSKKIPHIIFHGPSGTGKRTIVERFLSQIYENDRARMKTNIMWVNCAHGNGRGIKFIREELKFFAKSNIQFNYVLFKTIVLLNADSLTTDAQSALRRCIELFSFNTRFFIVVENKHKLLNPILSRFCEIYVPETLDNTSGKIVNLHAYNVESKFRLAEWNNSRMLILSDKMMRVSSGTSHKELIELCTELYELGYSCLDLVEWVRKTGDIDESKKSAIVLCFNKVKSEYRCEKMLMLYLMDYAFLRPNKDLENIGFI